MELYEIFLILIFAFVILIVSRLLDKSENNHPKKKKATKSRSINNKNQKQSLIKTDYNNIILFLQNEVSLRYGKGKKEKDYQQDLEGKLSVLEERYGYDVQYEAVNGKHRVDFIINGNIGIEMKVHRGGTQAQRELFNQITEYASYCDYIIGLVVNVTNDDPEILRNEILDKLSYQHAIQPTNYEIVVLDV